MKKIKRSWQDIAITIAVVISLALAGLTAYYCGMQYAYADVMKYQATKYQLEIKET